MDNEEVPMSYAIARISHNASVIFNILKTIYGVSAVIFIYKILKERPKI